jgi:hypothetical protein
MTRYKLACALASAVSLMAASSPALADVFASASLRNFRVALTDLRPQDGVRPSFRMLDDSGRSGLSSAQATIAGPSGYRDTSRLGHSQFDPVSAGRWQDGALARSGVSGDGTLEGLTLGSIGSATGKRTVERSLETLVSGGNSAYREGPTLYVLSPYTKLVLTADVKLKAKTTLGTYRRDGLRTEAAGAFATVQLNPIGADGSVYWPDGAGDSALIYIAGIWSPRDPFTRPAHQKVSDKLVVKLVNNSPHPMTATLHAITSADGIAALAILSDRSAERCASASAKRAAASCAGAAGNPQ